MSETNQQSPKQMPIGILLLISFTIFNLGPIIDQSIRWSDHHQGLKNGLFHMILYGLGWCAYQLPWSLAICSLYRSRKWKRFRTHWVLAPAVFIFVVSIGGLILEPITPANRFKDFAKTELPKDIRNLSYHFMGGGLADYIDSYYFETSAEEVERLVAEMNLVETEFYGDEGLPKVVVSSLPDCPDISSWQGAQQFLGDDDGWSYHLITDVSKTKVYMLISSL